MTSLYIMGGIVIVVLGLVWAFGRSQKKLGQSSYKEDALEVANELRSQMDEELQKPSPKTISSLVRAMRARFRRAGLQEPPSDSNTP